VAQPNPATHQPGWVHNTNFGFSSSVRALEMYLKILYYIMYAYMKEEVKEVRPRGQYPFTK
jgi:hypothetical protein